MPKNRSNSFKGVPVLGELAARADGHQLYSAPLNTVSQLAFRNTQAVPVFAPNGDIMPNLELLPWMVNFVDYIVSAVEPGATRECFSSDHQLGLLSGYFWELDEPDLHSYVAFRLGRTIVEADMWIRAPESKLRKEPYLGRQRIQIGCLDSNATFWLSDTDEPDVLGVNASRLQRALRRYGEWGDPKYKDLGLEELFHRYNSGDGLNEKEYDLLLRYGYILEP